MRRTGAVGVVVAIALLAVACSGPKDPAPPGGTTDRGHAVRLVVLGDQRAVGDPVPDPLHDGWPQVLFRTKLPSRTVYVDLAGDHETVADVRSGQLSRLAPLDPTLVIVWVGSEDEQRGIDETAFTDDLVAVVDAVRAGGAQVVLIAGAPFHDAISRVGAEHGAKVADVSGIDVEGGGQQAQQQVADQVNKAIGPLS